jgi:L-galactono-1,4-lactone dehydrogenase
VGELAEELRKYNLTLENFASINDQSVGGFIQAGCHGTGALVPPVNDQVEGLVLVTPGLGPIRILPGTHTFKDTQNEVDIKIIADDELFSLVKCGLGGLGIVYEVTLRCVPLENLEEVTKVFRLEELKKIHTRLLLENRHVRYMWYPFTDSVVVVTSNPTSKTAAPVALSHSHSLKPLREIMTHRTGGPSERPGDPTSLAAFRDALISLDPLNVDFIRQVNKAEVQCWKNLEGTRIGTSPEILSFDCGGQQCVYEVAFKVEQNCAHNESPDIEFVMRLLKRIETLNIPAPAPIEQRWSQSSSSMMSPAYSTSISDIFTWIGIIMYLPVGSDLHTLNARWNIKEVFHKVYTKVLLEAGPVDPLQLRAHWAKLDLPAPEGNELSELRAKLRKQYPLKLYNTYRRLLDPNSILTNQWMDLLIAQND